MAGTQVPARRPGPVLPQLDLLAAWRSRPRPADPGQAPHSRTLPLRDIVPFIPCVPFVLSGTTPASRPRPRNSNSAGPRPARADLCGLRLLVSQSHQPRPSNIARAGRGLLLPQLGCPSASRRRYQVQPAPAWTRFLRPQRSAPAHCQRSRSVCTRGRQPAVAGTLVPAGAPLRPVSQLFPKLRLPGRLCALALAPPRPAPTPGPRAAAHGANRPASLRPKDNVSAAPVANGPDGHPSTLLASGPIAPGAARRYDLPVVLLRSVRGGVMVAACPAESTTGCYIQCLPRAVSRKREPSALGPRRLAGPALIYNTRCAPASSACHARCCPPPGPQTPGRQRDAPVGRSSHPAARPCHFATLKNVVWEGRTPAARGCPRGRGRLVPVLRSPTF